MPLPATMVCVQCEVEPARCDQLLETLRIDSRKSDVPLHWQLSCTTQPRLVVQTSTMALTRFDGRKASTSVDPDPTSWARSASAWVRGQLEASPQDPVPLFDEVDVHWPDPVAPRRTKRRRVLRVGTTAQTSTGYVRPGVTIEAGVGTSNDQIRLLLGGTFTTGAPRGIRGVEGGRHGEVLASAQYVVQRGIWRFGVATSAGLRRGRTRLDLDVEDALAETEFLPITALVSSVEPTVAWTLGGIEVGLQGGPRLLVGDGVSLDGFPLVGAWAVRSTVGVSFGG